MLEKGLRLRKKEDFDRVFRSGEPLFFNGLGCRYLPGRYPFRVGFSLSKKNYPLAVERNRLRRIISGAISRLREERPACGDIVFIALDKAKTEESTTFELVRNIFKLIKKVQ